MLYKEAYQIEQRNSDNLLKIYLIKEGDWIRAYEWSCYLLSLLPSKKKEEGTSLSYMRKNWSFLPNEGLLIVGVKEIYLQPFLPSDVELVNDTINGHEAFVVDASKYLDKTDISLETYHKTLLEQKETVELSKPKQFNKNESNKKYNNTDTCVSEILKEIISFPILSKSPLDCYDFIKNVQSKIICKYIDNEL